MDALKAYLVKHFGLAADADEAAVKQLATKLAGEGKLTLSQILELNSPAPAAKSPLEVLADKLAEAMKAKGGDGAQTATAVQNGQTVSAPAPEADSVNRVALELFKALNMGQSQPDSAVQPAEALLAAAKAAGSGGAGGATRVKSPTEQ